MPADNNELFKDVVQMKAEMNQLNNLIGRLDTTIEKLTEVSTTISQLLAVQSNRLEHLEKMSQELSKEIDTNDNNVQSKLSVLEREIYKEMEQNQLVLLTEIKSLKETSQRQFEQMEQKLATVEKWMWLVSGGAAVVGFILSKITMKFF